MYQIIEYQDPELIDNVIRNHSYQSNDTIKIIVKYLHYMAGASGMSLPFVYISKNNPHFDI